MKKLLLPLLGLIVPFATHAQAVVFSESFDSYNPGDLVAQIVGTPWTTWSNAPGGTEDTPISDEQASSGTLSMKVSTTAAAGGPTDMILQLGDRTMGIWGLSWSMYIPTGQGAYFNMQHTQTPGTQWALDVTFPGAGTAGTIETANMDYPITYEHDTWFTVSMVIDLGTMQAVMQIGNNPSHVWAFNTQSSSAAAGLNQIGGINFFAYAGGVGPTTFYIDDVSFVDLTNVGISEESKRDINVFPNPAQDAITVELSEVGSTAVASLVDATGRVIVQGRTFNQNATSARTQLDLQGLPSGMYFIRVQDGDQEFVRRVTKL